jgi:F0F1-type ATP synthase membrane subunit b/b'
MDDSKALSPEIKGLFETVKQQARQYSHAFEQLDQVREDYDKLWKQTTEYNELLKKEHEATIKDINFAVHDFLEEVSSKTEKNIKIYDDLDNIKSIRETLFTLQTALKQQLGDLQIATQSIKSRADIEIDSAVTFAKTSIEKEVESIYQRLEARISSKIRDFQNRIYNHDQQILSLKDAHVRDNKSLTDEVSHLKNRINEIKMTLADLYKSIEKRIGELDNLKILNGNEYYTSQHSSNNDKTSSNNFSGQLDKNVTNELGRFRKNMEKELIGITEERTREILSDNVKEFEKNVNELKSQFFRMKQTLTQSEKKARIAMIIGGLSILFGLISLIIASSK